MIAMFVPLKKKKKDKISTYDVHSIMNILYY